MLLTALKIIGIAVLAVFAFVLLILLIVLLVPVRYDVKVRYAGEVKARLHIGWFLRAIHIKLEWLNDHGLLTARLLGLKTVKKSRLGDWGPQPEKDPVKTRPAASESAPDDADKPRETEKKADAGDTSVPRKAKDEAGRAQEEKTVRPAPDISGKKDEKTADAPGKEQAKPEKDRKGLAELDRKTAELAEKLDEYRGYLYDERNRKTLRLIKKQLRRIGKHLKPTFFLAEGELGFDDPAQTGKIMGLIYSLYPLYRDHIRIEGNYREPVMMLRAEVKGRLRLGVFVGAGLRLLLDRNLWRWGKKLMRKDKETKTVEDDSFAGTDREHKAA